ncbi:hypothetical protein ABIE44_000970 [Marmoricola sp. OAE513]|uniref:hypothetical protein n=1 Tax=Marmoricola sp. OAE513 TaxID=2817894 RepID=UPI001AE328D4
MEKSILRILVTFTVGFLAIGAVLGLIGVGDCGSVFSPDDGCGETLSVQRALVIAFVGLGLTSMAAAIFADAGAGVPDTTVDETPGEDLL